MNILRSVFDFVFPPRCIFCKKPLPKGTDMFCCDKCKDEYAFKIICCSKCSGVLSETSGKPVCYTCRAAGRHFDAAISSSRYSEKMRKAIHRYKFSYQTYMAKTLASFIVSALETAEVNYESFDLVINIPPDKVRKLRRGFDHTALFAKYLSEELNIPFGKGFIKKIKRTRPQHLLNARQRASNVKGAYKMADMADVKGKTVLLIDDVFTTGSTAREVSGVLKRAGAKYVLVATVAKSVSRI